jgi:murein DD-endopeptidase MepM/ murein hydrolase activator NlpD
LRRTIVLTIVLAAFPAVAHAWVLERGDRGDGVRLVQRALTALGLRTSVDGAFGPGTERSVLRYERREGLPVDGRVSRGQLRGMLRRIGETMPPEFEDSAPSARTRAAPSEDGFAFPIDGEWEWGKGETGFGDRGGAHDGEDVFADCGTPLVAARPGKVVFKDSDGSAGNYLVIRGEDEDFVYMHLQAAARVDKGDAVAAGESLGAVGRTGNASACHLHFEIWTSPGWYEGGHARDPRPDLERWASS